MQKLQLYIDNDPDINVVNYVRIDLFKDEQVSFNQSIQNIKDPAKIFTEFTQTFTVPASKVNNQVFEHYYNFNVVNPNDFTESAFDARNKRDAKIELNNIAFKQGYVRLEGVDMKLNKVYAYRITFFGQTVNVKDILREDKLGNLSDLNQYNLNYDAATVKARLQSASGAILCPLITSGASGEESRLFYNSNTSAHTNDTGNLYYHTGGGQHDHGVLYSDLKYAIRLYEIVEAIKVTYPSLVFTDDFFSTTNPEFYNLHMWLHRKKGSVAPAEQVAAFPTLVTGFGLPQTYTNMIDSSGLQIDANYLPTITQRLTINTSSTDSYDVIINRGTTVWFTASNLTGNSLFDEGDMGFMDAATYTVIIRTTTNITFTNTDTPPVGIKWELSGYQPTSPPIGWSEEYSISSFSATATFQFVITEQIPDMKIIDFLTGIFRMFNLTAYYVSNRQDADYGKIKVQKLDEFYIAGTSYDISEYVDTTTSQVNVALPYKEIEFGYEGTGTLLALQYEQLQGKSWGAEEFTGNATVGNNFDGPNPIYKVKLPFEHIQMERLVDVNPDLASPQTTIQYGYFVDDNLEAYFGKPLIFYPILQTSGTEMSFRDSATTHSPLTSYFVPSNSLSLIHTTSRININFYLEVNEYTLNTSFTETLFERNYLEYIQDIFNSKRRLTKLKAYLPLKIIYNLNMNDTVVINNQGYLINNLTTNLNTGESSMELLNEKSLASATSSLSLTNVEWGEGFGPDSFYYNASIGNASNLAVGDIIYIDSALTNPINDTSYNPMGQAASSATTTYCSVTGSFMYMLTNGTNGAITSINCYMPLTQVYYDTSSSDRYTYYYNTSIGAASNLAIGDTVYSNPTLTTTLPADTYYQDNSSASTTHCSQSGYIMTMVINSSGVITAIGCYQP